MNKQRLFKQWDIFNSHLLHYGSTSQMIYVRWRLFISQDLGPAMNNVQHVPSKHAIMCLNWSRTGPMLLVQLRHVMACLQGRELIGWCNSDVQIDGLVWLVPMMAHRQFHSLLTVTSYERHGVSNHWQLDRWPVDSPHKWPVMRKEFPCHGVTV